MAELIQDIFDQHKIDGKKSIAHDERRWKLHLQPFFGNLRAVQVTTDLLRRYVKAEGTPREVEQATAKRHDQSRTVRSTVGVLPRVCGDPPKVYRVPTFPMLQEDNT
jgi:hypothetical protein